MARKSAVGEQGMFSARQISERLRERDRAAGRPVASGRPAVRTPAQLLAEKNDEIARLQRQLAEANAGVAAATAELARLRTPAKDMPGRNAATAGRPVLSEANASIFAG